MTPPLSSRPTAPFALVLGVFARPATTFNGHDVPAFDGFSDADQQTIWGIVRDALKSWNIDVTMALPNKPWVGVGFSTTINGYPGSGQANLNTWQTGGWQAFVFVDKCLNNATYCGQDAVHEAGHVLTGANDIITVDPATGEWFYTPGFWQGNCFAPSPVWTPDQRSTLDTRFGPCADLNFDGKVDSADMNILRQGGYTAVEAVAVIRESRKESVGK